MTETDTPRPQGPLTGYRVLELCSTIAGPVCARLFADFGADVIKVEPPAGDPVRKMGWLDGDVELYGASLFRNKRAAVIDLKTPEGVDLVKRIAATCDVVVENFRPGTLERLGLGYDVISADNPGLVLVRISGYGQTGPKSAEPGYGAICEAYAGVRHLTGDPDRPPARVALAVTDYLTAVYAAFGACMALLERERTGRGQVVDTALYEAAFSMMEQVVPAYDRLGLVPTRMGSRLQGMAPNSLYLAADDVYVLIAANNDATFRRLATAMGKPELCDDPRFCGIVQRSQNADAVDAEVESWTRARPGREAVEILTAAQVPVSLVQRISDIFEEEHYRVRDMLLRLPHPKGGDVMMPGVTPKLSATPGAVRHAGPGLGADTWAVLQELLGLETDEMERLEANGIFGAASG